MKETNQDKPNEEEKMKTEETIVLTDELMKCVDIDLGVSTIIARQIME